MIPSGNVFTGSRTASPQQVTFFGVPVVPPGAGTRRFRITNLRALPPPASAAGLAPIQAFVSIWGPMAIPVTNPMLIVGFVSNGLNFSHLPMLNNLVLKFEEVFPSAFKKRIENNAGGPLTAIKQNHPGILHCTESGFNPDFTAVTPGATGSANTGTRLAAKITGIPVGVMFVFGAQPCGGRPDRGGPGSSALRPTLRQRSADGFGRGRPPFR